MNEAGYTLAETLAALLIIGLAFAGLSEATRVLGRVQGAASASTAATTRAREVQRLLDALLEHAGPFRSDDASRFTGSAQAFQFDCNRPSKCGAALKSDANGALLSVQQGDGVETQRLVEIKKAQFAYLDDTRLQTRWPPSPGERRRLRSIALLSGDSGQSSPIATVRLWREQEARCEFDPIAEDCRLSAP